MTDDITCEGSSDERLRTQNPPRLREGLKFLEDLGVEHVWGKQMKKRDLSGPNRSQ
jgi:hypothetical protein